MMSKLWGMIRSLQIILFLPLTLVNMPPNVQLLYFFMTYNFNFYFIPLGSISLNMLSFGSKEAESPFNDQFDNQDIF